MVAAIPVMLTGCETDWKSFYEGPGARPEMAMGSDFCTANGFRICWLMTLARWVCIPFSLLGGYICFRWGRELYGTMAGLLSLTLWCFCPNIIAHGQLITSDVAATSLGVAACYTFWHWLKKPTWWNTLTSGAILGVAELTKSTLIIFYPLWPLLWLIYRWPERKTLTRSDWFGEFGKLCARVVLALYVINLGYGFEGSFTRLGDYKFVSDSLSGLDEQNAGAGGNRFAESFLGSVPVPLPMNYLVGIDLQRRDFEHYHSKFYLGGVWSKTGWWYYYLYALAIKVPLGTWLLLILAAAGRFVGKATARFRDEFFLLMPGIVILTFVSSQTGMNEHMRYVLPIFPFFIIWIGRIVPCLQACFHHELRYATFRRSLGGTIATAGLCWSVGSSLFYYPHSLSYFNELIGGPKNGWKYLTNSNIDWGQDMLQLKRWVDSHPEAKPLTVACFGINYRIFDIVAAEKMPPNSRFGDEGGESLLDGWYAVSASILAGRKDRGMDYEVINGLADMRPIDSVGGSIFLFHIKQASKNNVRILTDSTTEE
jgi:hypothetical protein